jgi:hypothetical protein
MSARTIVSNEPALKQMHRPDGKRALSIVKSSGGFRYVEDAVVEAAASSDLPAHTYWEESARSGIYESAEAAWAAALVETDWLEAAESENR